MQAPGMNQLVPVELFQYVQIGIVSDFPAM